MGPKIKKEIEILTIDDAEILPGESATVNIMVGRLPSGTRIDMKGHVFRSVKPGPTILILGGIHGDEINGIEAIRRSIYNEYFDSLTSGTIIAIPVVNIYGFINFSREVPDGKDVNRSFPGNFKGSLASRVAKIISSKILPEVDYIIDLHTGGSSRYNYPQIRYTDGDKASKEIAKVFGAPFMLKKGLIDHSLRQTALKMKIPILVFEGGESLRLDGFSIQIAIDGIKRVLNHFNMTNHAISERGKIKHFKSTSWIRAAQSGLFVWSKKSGQKIVKDEPIAIINDPHGLRSATILAPQDGYIVGHNNASVVNQGDALFNIGISDETL